jgi:hypothetical protein
MIGVAALAYVICIVLGASPVVALDAAALVFGVDIVRPPRHPPEP